MSSQDLLTLGIVISVALFFLWHSSGKKTGHGCGCHCGCDHAADKPSAPKPTGPARPST
jgi:hypothetical protein